MKPTPRQLKSQQIQEANDGWNNNRERALCDIEDYIAPLIEAADEVEAKPCGKNPRVATIVQAIDAFIDSERSEKRIAERVALMDAYDAAWKRKFDSGLTLPSFQDFCEATNRHLV